MNDGLFVLRRETGLDGGANSLQVDVCANGNVGFQLAAAQVVIETRTADNDLALRRDRLFEFQIITTVTAGKTINRNVPVDEICRILHFDLDGFEGIAAVIGNFDIHPKCAAARSHARALDLVR